MLISNNNSTQHSTCGNPSLQLGVQVAGVDLVQHVAVLVGMLVLLLLRV